MKSDIALSNVTSLSTLPSLGEARLDDDQDEMRALIESLRMADQQSVLRVFDDLHAHTAQHFAIEDALMRSIEFSSRECHLDEHAAVRQSFDEVRAALCMGRTDVVGRFADQLRDWLPEHVDALDRHLAKFLFAQKNGGARLVLHR